MIFFNPQNLGFLLSIKLYTGSQLKKKKKKTQVIESLTLDEFGLEMELDTGAIFITLFQYFALLYRIENILVYNGPVFTNENFFSFLRRQYWHTFQLKQKLESR